jgi:multiple sugar transport system substrate-binding protein
MTKHLKKGEGSVNAVIKFISQKGMGEMMKRQYLRLGIMVLLGVLMLTALVSAENVTTIQYAFWGNPTAIGIEKDIIEEFEKANPAIKVQPVAVAYNDYHTKLLTLLAGGQAPDVMRVDSYFFADFMNARALKDITRLIKSSKLDLSKYYQAGLGDCLKNKHYYGLPWGTAPVYMMLNLKMFKEAGIPLPSENWTYADFLQLAKKFSKGTGAERQYGYGFTATGMEHVLPFVWRNGGDLFDKKRQRFTLNQAAACKAIQGLADLVKTGVFPDPAQFTSAEVLNRWMANNKVAMREGTAAEMVTMQNMEGFQFEVLPVPGTAKYPRVNMYKSNVVGISSTTKKERAAWTFLKFLRGPGSRGEVLYCQAKRVPPAFDTQKLWELYCDPNKYPKNIFPVTQKIVKSTSHLLPLRTGWMEVSGMVNPQLQRVYAGQVTAEQAMKEIAPKVQAILDRTK